MFEIIPARSESNQTILDWYRRKDQINFYPPYQRASGLWDLNARQLFIDSIINGFDVPKFYMHKNWYSNGEKYLYSLIDGKQRLQCIFDFIDNEFPLSKNFVFDNDDTFVIAEKKYDYIAVNYPKIIDRFDRYILDIVQIITNDDEIIREMFLRLNEGVSLNNSEKRLSKGGFLNNKIKAIVSTHEFFQILRFRNTRYSYEEILTKILLLEFHSNLTSLTKTKLDNFTNFHKIKNEEIEEVLSRTIRTLDIMCFVFYEIEELLTQKATIPIYYLFIRDSIHFDINTDQIKQFLYRFEQIKYENRKMKFDRLNPILNEFDRLNQQGSNSINAIRERLSILNQYFEVFKIKGNIDSYTLINQEIEDDY